MAELAAEGLTKTLGSRTVLRGLDMTVPSGARIAVLGASGAGKTTLLRCLCGFERLDAGCIRIAGETVAGPRINAPPERRRIGYVAQEGALFPHLSVADNVSFGLSRRARRERRRVDELLELVGLPYRYAARSPHQLSGGEQQRVALARALAPEPALVLLDEPFSALDAALRAETRDAVTEALAAAGATALLVTHDQGEAFSIGQQVGVLRDGVLVQVAAPEVLYRQPVDAALARFVGEAVLLPGTAEGGQVHCALGDLPLGAPALPGPVEVMIRPEQIRLSASPDGGTLRAHVDAVVFYGRDAEVRISLLAPAPAITVKARVPSYASPGQGEQVYLTVEGDVIAYPLRAANAVSCRSAVGPSRVSAAIERELT